MKSKKQKMIDFLLKNANPSIKRRVKSEILHNLIADEAALYQEQICRKKRYSVLFRVSRKMAG